MSIDGHLWHKKETSLLNVELPQEPFVKKADAPGGNEQGRDLFGENLEEGLMTRRRNLTPSLPTPTFAFLVNLLGTTHRT